MNPKTLSIDKLNEISYDVLAAAYKVHSEIGPGLLESTYEACLECELLHLGMKVERQKVLPIRYRNMELKDGYRIDLLVEDCLIVELKSVEKITPIFKAQVMTYLKLSGLKLALLLNFNVTSMKNGINRIVYDTARNSIT